MRTQRVFRVECQDVAKRSELEDEKGKYKGNVVK